MFGVKVLFSVCAMFASLSIIANVTGTYELEFDELKLEGRALSTTQQEFLKEWWNPKKGEAVRIHVRATEEDDPYDEPLTGIWLDAFKDSKAEKETGFPLTQFPLFGDNEFGFVFDRNVAGIDYWFRCTGTISDETLRGTLNTVWGDVSFTGRLNDTVSGNLPITGKFKNPEIAGTYVLSFGELSPPHALPISEGTRYLKEWLEPDVDNEVSLELRATDFRNQFDANWKDSTTEVLEGWKMTFLFVHEDGTSSFVFARRINDVPYIFAWDGTIEEGKLDGILRTPWGELSMTAKLKPEEGSASPDGKKMSEENDN